MEEFYPSYYSNMAQNIQNNLPETLDESLFIFDLRNLNSAGLSISTSSLGAFVMEEHNPIYVTKCIGEEIYNGNTTYVLRIVCAQC